jgi:hypothetical protein
MTDWTAIDQAYISTDRSVRDIGREHGLSYTAIQKAAKRRGWKRAMVASPRDPRAPRDIPVRREGKPPLNKTETKIYDWLEKHGATILKGGWPDFLCVVSKKRRKVFCVEVKATGDPVTPAQRAVPEILAEAGIPVYVIDPYEPLYSLLLDEEQG